MIAVCEGFFLLLFIDNLVAIAACDLLSKPLYWTLKLDQFDLWINCLDQFCEPDQQINWRIKRFKRMFGHELKMLKHFEVLREADEMSRLL